MSKKVQKVAVLGGSFDPPTDAHLLIAANAVQSGAADEVWLLPCGPRPDKASVKTTALQRCIMCHLAVNERFPGDFPIKVCDMEVHLPRFMPFYYAWKKLTDEYGEKKSADGTIIQKREFFMLMGSDLYPSMSKWSCSGVPGYEDIPNYPEVVWNEVPYLIYPREGYPIDESNIPKKAEIIKTPAGQSIVTSNASSTEVRNRLKLATQNSSTTPRSLHCVYGLVPESVAKHIVREELYVEW